MIHPDTELRHVSDVIGYGVFATKDIPAGTITWVRDDLDLALSPAQFAGVARVHRPILDRYTFVDGRGDHVLCWDLGRYVNHSCFASCLAPGFDFEIAVRDIARGEELTDDYGALNVDDAFACACGHARCRRRILRDDPLRHAAEWDARIARAFPHMGLLAQPLWELVREKDEVRRVLAGQAPVPSSMGNWFRGAPGSTGT